MASVEEKKVFSTKKYLALTLNYFEKSMIFFFFLLFIFLQLEPIICSYFNVNSIKVKLVTITHCQLITFSFYHLPLYNRSFLTCWISVAGEREEGV